METRSWRRADPSSRLSTSESQTRSLTLSKTNNRVSRQAEGERLPCKGVTMEVEVTEGEVEPGEVGAEGEEGEVEVETSQMCNSSAGRKQGLQETYSCILPDLSTICPPRRTDGH